jgi:hypothetical protein
MENKKVNKMSLYRQEMEKFSEDTIEFSKQWFRKFAKSYPAYHFVTKYAEIMMENDEKSPEGIFGRRFARILRMESDKDINNELRLIEIEKDLIPLIQETDNKVFYRNLFFPSIFINNDFNFERLIIKGIYLTECYSEPNSNSYALHHPNPNDYAIFVVAVDIEEGSEFYLSAALINKAIGESFTDTKEEFSRMKRLSNYIRVLICNIIDMVEGNDEDIEVVTIETTKDQNLKRFKKGKIAIPTKVYIRSKGKFKKYVSEFHREISKPSHSFPVRGHWRNFRDERFINVYGTKIWIKPFIKGQGIMLTKDYKLTK